MAQWLWGRLAVAGAALLLPAAAAAADPREHELKLPIGGEPGPLNAITDVAGVEVGHSDVDPGQRDPPAGQGTGADRGHRRSCRAARPIRTRCSAPGSRSTAMAR